METHSPLLPDLNSCSPKFDLLFTAFYNNGAELPRSIGQVQWVARRQVFRGEGAPWSTAGTGERNTGQKPGVGAVCWTTWYVCLFHCLLLSPILKGLGISDIWKTTFTELPESNPCRQGWWAISNHHLTSLRLANRPCRNEPLTGFEPSTSHSVGGCLDHLAMETICINCMGCYAYQLGCNKCL